MIFEQSAKFKLVNLLIAITFLWMTAVCPCQAQEADKQDPTIGEIKLEGKSINRLILQREDNNEKEEFRRPEQTIKLPAGKYRLHEAHLEGGYVCYASRDSKRIMANVTSDEPAILKIGAPLKQIIKVNRQGRNLVMNYELLGVGGEKYTGGNSGEKPTFTIYKKDKEIASGKFEYG
ncbi:MAG: hypothetical protein GY774_07960 [Planctomycetes bacterium]|nr:hypothetical protein [Planctomycetota bacterium]